MATIAIVGGGGYVGLTYAAAFAELQHDVIGLDVDLTKVRMLTEGQLPIYEPDLEALLRRGLAGGRLRFTEDYADAVGAAEFVFICVGTPSAGDGRADMRHVLAAIQAVGQHARRDLVVVTKSTMPVGSLDLIADILAEHADEHRSFALVSNPEFLREGSAVHDLFHPARIVVGSSDLAAAERVAALYAPLSAPVLITDPRTAEMIKYASNAFLATKISFVNEVAMICERLGADVGVVARGMGMDERIGPQLLQAGIGFGGSCFPKDVRALAAMARATGIAPSMLDAVLGINAMMRGRVIDKLTSHLGDLRGKTIAVLGLAFKPDTDDIREAPAIEIIGKLLAAGAKVRAADPAAGRRAAVALPEVVITDDPFAAAMGADAVVLATEWSAYRAIDLDHLANAMRGRLLIDGRNALDPAAVVQAGFIYEAVGRSVSAPKRLTLIQTDHVPVMVAD
ncbi:MAG: UDP-glucose dehydrogenase family protein [Thermomicrobiales bacterium]